MRGDLAGNHPSFAVELEETASVISTSDISVSEGSAVVGDKGSVWLLRVARGDTQRQIRLGPTSAPTISALFAASNVFDRTLMPTVVGLGRGRTSTCSMTSFAIHGTVTELDLQRRIRLFP